MSLVSSVTQTSLRLWEKCCPYLIGLHGRCMKKLGLRELSTCPRSLSSVTTVAVTLDIFFNIISWLAPEKLQLKLNCLIVNCKDQGVDFLSKLLFFFSAVSQIYFFLVNNQPARCPGIDIRLGADWCEHRQQNPRKTYWLGWWGDSLVMGPRECIYELSTFHFLYCRSIN